MSLSEAPKIHSSPLPLLSFLHPPPHPVVAAARHFVFLSASNCDVDFSHAGQRMGWIIAAVAMLAGLAAVRPAAAAAAAAAAVTSSLHSPSRSLPPP
jgi:hypothetical protein